MKKTRDICLLKNLVHINSFTTTFAYCNKLIFYILVLPYTALTCMCLVRVYIYHIEGYFVTPVEVVCSIGSSSANICFSALCLIQLSSHKTFWQIFFKNMHKFDLKATSNNRFHYESCVLYYVKFIVLNMIYITLFILKYIGATAVNKNFFAFIYRYFINSQILISMFVLRHIFKILEKRFKYYEVEIRNTYSSIPSLWFRNSSSRLKRLYLYLNTEVKIINVLFGQRILFVLSIACFHVLGVFQNVIVKNSYLKYQSDLYLWCQFITIVFYLVSNCIILDFSQQVGFTICYLFILQLM